MTSKKHTISQLQTDDKLHQFHIEAGIKKGLDDVRQDRVSPFTITNAKRLKRNFQETNS